MPYYYTIYFIDAFGVVNASMEAIAIYLGPREAIQWVSCGALLSTKSYRLHFLITVEDQR